MDVTEFSLDLGGGRSLDVRVAGPEDGIALFSHHGTSLIVGSFPSILDDLMAVSGV